MLKIVNLGYFKQKLTVQIVKKIFWEFRANKIMLDYKLEGQLSVKLLSPFLFMYPSV